eukprot:g24126.t1
MTVHGSCLATRMAHGMAATPRRSLDSEMAEFLSQLPAELLRQVIYGFHPKDGKPMSLQVGRFAQSIAESMNIPLPPMPKSLSCLTSATKAAEKSAAERPRLGMAERVHAFGLFTVSAGSTSHGPPRRDVTEGCAAPRRSLAQTVSACHTTPTSISILLTGVPITLSWVVTAKQAERVERGQVAKEKERANTIGRIAPLP